MEMIYHEYMASPGSMAAQMYDLKKVLKKKYNNIICNEDLPYPYKQLQHENNSENLSDLLALYTNDVLKNIIDSLKVDINKNGKKDILILVLSKEIVKNFESFLGIMNDNMYTLLSKFKRTPKVALRDIDMKSSLVKYLLKRGYLFRAISKDNEVLLMPEELRLSLNRLDEDKTNRSVEKNTTICKIGENLIYYYGVIEEYDFYRYFGIMLNNFDKGNLDIKISFSKLNRSAYYHEEELYSNMKTVFKNYVQYTKEVHEVCFDFNYHSNFLTYHSVFDPFNIYFEQQRRKDLDFFPVCCRDLMDTHIQDTKAKATMSEYLIKHLQISPLEAQTLIEEWSCYVKNGENYNIYIDNIFMYLNFKSTDQFNEMLSFSSMHFVNALTQWLIKGHTPNELAGIKLKEKQQNLFLKPIIETKQIAVKIGRNDPCSCGSGKKYKKCCGR
jgi:uncharacterized protein YchJ